MPLTSVREPTADECEANARVDLPDGRTGYACWYPQMGGYVGKAVAVPDGDSTGSCFDVFVWHDGDFPFSDGLSPTELHYCDPDQFVRFGRALQRMAGTTVPMDDDNPAVLGDDLL